MVAAIPEPALSRPAVAWRDHKKYLWPIGLLIPALQFLAVWGLRYTDSLAWAWTGPIVLFIVVPIVDLLLGRDKASPPLEAIPALEADRWYRWCTYLYLPVQYLGFFVVFSVLADPAFGVVTKIGVAMSVGIVGGVAIATAHEMGHKREQVEKWMSKIALAPTFYGHFFIEHNHGHHVRVATPDDPASSRLGEGFWAFWPRTVFGSLRSAWRLELKRLRRRKLPWWSLKNDIVSANLMSVAIMVALVALYGWKILPWFFLQAVVGFSLLEVVNYLEHYGLKRQKMADGRFERVRAVHSWNCDSVTTNLLLYHLQRHSDHHANPTRRYQSLRTVDDAPELPAGYAAMITMALVPPVWHRVMDRRVVAHYGGDLGLANVSPKRLAQLEARFGAAAAGRGAA